jgi:hypothetical protein
LGILILDTEIYMNNNTKLFCLLLKAQKIDKSSEQGYAMAVVSMLSIIMFSLLAASMIFSNLAKSRTDAFVDSHSSFSVAESGLNKRAIEFRKKLETYSGVDGVIEPIGDRALSSCFGLGIPAGTSSESTPTGTNDFECRNYRFESSNNISKVAAGANIALNSGGQDKNAYVAYTFVADRTNYTNGAARYIPIPTGERFAGLNAAEYNYVVYSAGKKPVTLPQNLTLPVYTDDQRAAVNRQQQGKTAEANDPALIAAYNNIKSQAEAAGAAAAAEGRSSNNASLSMTFTNRVVPLFQFGIFYNGDMEFNSTAPMQINGWVHSNANIYVQPAGVNPDEAKSITTFLANVSAVGSIYNRIDAWTPGVGRTGITRVLLTGNSCATTQATPSNCQDIPAYDAGVSTPLTLQQVNAFSNKKVQDGTAGTTLLITPSPGFTRKRNYADDKIGKYYAQADMRLEMVPDRDVTSKASTPWIRNEAIIPFNFTAIRTGGTGVCVTTLPAANTDPDPAYVDPTREKISTRHCNKFTKGQLQSLRQPVMVLTNINQTNGLRTTEDTTLGKPSTLVPPLPAVVPPVLDPIVINATKTKILRALQVALVSTPAPVPFENLDTLFDDPVYASGSLGVFKTGFSYLLDQIPIAELPVNDKITLLKTSPKQIAALMDAWFLPAPIQRVERPAADTDLVESAKNLRSSGFYDGREHRWITMLQTNIASLSVWNRDGVYVDALDAILTSVYATDNAARGIAFAGGNSTNELAFDRANPDSTKPVGSLQYLGLGSSDKTEGGLVFHASVSDDLDGNGTISATHDITIDRIAANEIRQKNTDNSDYIDPDTGNVVVLDYLRTYPADPTNPSNAKRKSPFAFTFNGGNYLPNALLLSSDQSIYIQGNFNNNGAVQPDNSPNTPSGDRLPASIVADTITALSNECINPSVAANNFLGIRIGQIKCGLPPTIDGTPKSYESVSSAMTINAALLSNTPVSNGNKGAGRLVGGIGSESYSGGVNNYIRLLEDWNNNDVPYALNYMGSLISLGAPLEYSGDYKPGGGDPAPAIVADRPYYNIPFRNFNYDVNFRDVEKLPPLTPKASYVQQKNFGRTY